VIGFDGSQMMGRDEVAAELGRIFADHETATYVAKVRSVTRLDANAGLLRAVAGMVPPGGGEIMPDRNAIQTVVARRASDDWSVVLFQTTPARFDGHPELAEALTAELAELVPLGVARPSPDAPVPPSAPQPSAACPSSGRRPTRRKPDRVAVGGQP
jgi:uncharacterized protein (TIGR02246 family)